MTRKTLAWLATSAFLVLACSSSTDNSGDRDRPTVTIDQAALQFDPTQLIQIDFTVQFSEPVTGFTASDISFVGSTSGGTPTADVSTVGNGDGSTYSVAVTGMAGDGTVVASIPAGAAVDSAGNRSRASTSSDNTVTFIDVAPNVTINQDFTQHDPFNAGIVFFSVVFSEPVTGFTDTEVSFAGSTVGGNPFAAINGSGSNYLVSVGGFTGNGILVASLPPGVAVDPVGHPSFASTSLDNSVTIDIVLPGVTINQAPAQADPTTSNSVQFAVQFTEPVIGFTASDVSYAGSTVGGTLTTVVTGDGTNFTVSASGMTTNGTVVASIPFSSATDLASNPSLASTSVDNSVTWQNTAPSVTINQAIGQSDPAREGLILFTVQFSEPVTGFSAGDVSFAGSTAPGTLTASITGTGPAYTVSVAGTTESGTIVVSIPAGSALDAGGLGNTVSTSTDNAVTLDATSPSVTINQAVGQSDPTTGATIQYTVQFSEPVTGFTAADVSFRNSTVVGTLVATVTGTGANYTVSVTGMSGVGIVVANLPAGAAVDSAGNPNLASTSDDNVVTHQ